MLERKVSLVLKELVYGEESYYRSHRWHLSIGAGAGHIIPVSVLVLCCLLCTCVFIVRTLAFGERTHPNNAGCFLLNPVVAGLIQATPLFDGLLRGMQVKFTLRGLCPSLSTQSKVSPLTFILSSLLCFPSDQLYNWKFYECVCPLPPSSKKVI